MGETPFTTVLLIIVFLIVVLSIFIPLADYCCGIGLGRKQMPAESSGATNTSPLTSITEDMCTQPDETIPSGYLNLTDGNRLNITPATLLMPPSQFHSVGTSTTCLNAVDTEPPPTYNELFGTAKRLSGTF